MKIPSPLNLDFHKILSQLINFIHFVILTCIKYIEKVLNTMRLLLIIIFILSLQTFTKADDIRDFEMEGISIGDSLLDFYSLTTTASISTSTYNPLLSNMSGTNGPYPVLSPLIVKLATPLAIKILL